MASREHAEGGGPKSRALIVDDHPMIRHGLVQLLNEEPDIEVCAQTGSGREALEMAARQKPDIAIVDLRLPDVDGIDLIKDLKSRYPQMAILVLSMRDERVYAERALRAGAKGYVAKGEAPSNVMAAIRRVLKGRVHLSDELTTALLHRLVDSASPEESFPAAILSDRELQVLTMIGEGMGPNQIAERLHLSVRTVETYRAHIKEKLNLEDAAALRQYAIQWMRSRG